MKSCSLLQQKPTSITAVMVMLFDKTPVTSYVSLFEENHIKNLRNISYLFSIARILQDAAWASVSEPVISEPVPSDMGPSSHIVIRRIVHCHPASKNIHREQSIKTVRPDQTRLIRTATASTTDAPQLLSHHDTLLSLNSLVSQQASW